MKTSLIIFAIIVITGLGGVMGSAQEKGRARGNRQIDGGSGRAGSQAVTKRNRITVPTGSGNDTFRSSRVKDGTSNTLMSARSRNGRTETVDKNETITVHGRSSSRANSITFEGNDEPLWAKRTSSQQLVQGNYIGTDVRPRRTGLFGDSDGDSDVDASDYALRSSSQKNNVSASRRSGIAGGDFNNDSPDTIGRSSLKNAGRPQSLSAGTYGRGNRQNGLMALLIP